MEKKPINIDNVRQVIHENDIDVNNTNANAIRSILGRGSMGTIQKHLETIRNEIEAAGKPNLKELSITPDDDMLLAIWNNVAVMVHQKALETINDLHTSKASLMDENSEMKDCMIKAEETNSEYKETIANLEKANKALNDRAETQHDQLSFLKAKLEESHNMIKLFKSHMDKRDI